MLWCAPKLLSSGPWHSGSVTYWLLTAEQLLRREGVTGSYALQVKAGRWLPQGCTCPMGAASQLLGVGCEGLGPLPPLWTS